VGAGLGSPVRPARGSAGSLASEGGAHFLLAWWPVLRSPWTKPSWGFQGRPRATSDQSSSEAQPGVEGTAPCYTKWCRRPSAEQRGWLKLRGSCIGMRIQGIDMCAKKTKRNPNPS
jgi:hypothetical protein